MIGGCTSILLSVKNPVASFLKDRSKRLTITFCCSLVLSCKLKDI